VIENCGTGLGPNGYYVCAVAGGIDRIYGWNVGRKSLPLITDDMEDHLERFCSHCGHFKRRQEEPFDGPIMSETWQGAYQRYRIQRTQNGPLRRRSQARRSARADRYERAAERARHALSAGLGRILLKDGTQPLSISTCASFTSSTICNACGAERNLVSLIGALPEHQHTASSISSTTRPMRKSLRQLGAHVKVEFVPITTKGPSTYHQRPAHVA